MAKAKDRLGIGLLGLGTVGGGVGQALIQRPEHLAEQVGCPLVLRRALVRDAGKRRSFDLPPGLLARSVQEVVGDPDVDVVVEAVGGEQPAASFLEIALRAGKPVATANKEVMAKHGPRLLALARERGCDLRFEASVGGGLPVIALFQRDLLANRIAAFHAIINGTTNYILTRMDQEGLDFAAALKQAQALGYAEPNPADDIEGTDATYKLAILASLAFRTQVYPEDIHREGISRLTPRDFRYARELGYTIKLLAIARAGQTGLQVRVHPAFIPQDWLLAKVDGVFNALQVEGDLVGRLLVYGRGAGPQPTASALLADVIEIARRLHGGLPPSLPPLPGPGLPLVPMGDLEVRHYFRISVADRPGVLAQMASILGDRRISIASVIQKEADPQAGTAEIVMMTHPARESAVQSALAELARLEVVKEIGSWVRVEA
ncbi:MAG: homoserine dehydrogenase [Chloroflexi bacterium]|nr:homoserine dehydrogenase [Chloroflexota bacterium]